MNILNTLFVLAVASIATANPMANPGNNLETRGCATVLKSCEQHSDCCTGPSYDRCQNMKIYAQTYLREEGKMRQSVRVTDTQEAYSTLQVKA
ncbi:hypothetical protein F9C07_3280 [Aspergillus flavus]|uniref:Uncharacterized protein n=1 Tax=Aspergillus flavus (strain ATCC 200026 / FGSC A1120 / IAM 13836 / NRRL 3357 / JCM 12722 / SRRC 167) TaxID=332952 RepID=A0A7U2MT89_ASPFN|nr:hypothetical protein F9C07_3280 [Aspergillus flavus]